MNAFDRVLNITCVSALQYIDLPITLALASAYKAIYHASIHFIRELGNAFISVYSKTCIAHFSALSVYLYTVKPRN